MSGFAEIFTFSTPAPIGFSFADIERYATSSLKWRNVRTRMTSFSAKNLARLKVYIIKRKFSFLEWICHAFHLVKRENVYFIRGFATHEICIFRFTRWNKWHIHSKNLNILYLLHCVISLSDATSYDKYIFQHELQSSKYSKEHCVNVWPKYKCTQSLTHSKSWINKTWQKHFCPVISLFTYQGWWLVIKMK